MSYTISPAAVDAPSDAPGHAVELRFTDGVTRSLRVPQGVNVLEAGLVADMPLLHQCRSGSCLSCIATLASGTTIQRAGGSTLLRSEYEAGQRLLCQTEPQGACTFDLAYTSIAGAEQPRKALALVDEVERLAPNVVRLKLELAEGQCLSFKSGQFVQIAIPGTDGVFRSYSPASTPEALPSLEFLIRLLPGGAMSAWLTDQANRDDVVAIEGPFGAFFLREKVRAPHIMVAGGTGLAPILSIIDSLRAQSGRKPRILLSFGCANADSLFALDDIALRCQWLPTLETRISVDQGGTPWLTGNPVDTLRDDDAADPDTVAYLCGPPPMVDAAYRRLEAIGVRPANIFAEQFVASN